MKSALFRNGVPQSAYGARERCAYEKSAYEVQLDVDDVTGEKVQRAWSEEEHYSLERTVKEFKRMLTEKYEEHSDSGWYSLMYQLFNKMGKYIQRPQTLSVLESCPHEHANTHINLVFRRTLQSRRAQIMETVS